MSPTDTASFSPPTPDQSRIDAVMELIANRRSVGVGRLRDTPVDPAIVQQALEAANWAPSNGDTEPWRFTVIAGEGRAALAKAFGEAYGMDAEADGTFAEEKLTAQTERAYHAPLWISIGVEPGRMPDGSLKMPMEDELMAVASAVQNMHLVLTAHGLIGMWHSKGTSVHPHVGRFLGLEEPARLLGLFWCGYPNVEWPEGEREPLEKKVRWIL